MKDVLYTKSLVNNLTDESDDYFEKTFLKGGKDANPGGSPFKQMGMFDKAIKNQFSFLKQGVSN